MEYPGFANIAKRVATLIAAGTPPEIVWYGAGQAMNLALENQLADVGDVIKATGGVADNLRMVYKGADRSIPTSQQFTYGWYRKDLLQKKGLEPPKTWDDYLKVAKALSNPPQMYGCIVPSAETGASTILLETMFMERAAQALAGGQHLQLGRADEHLRQREGRHVVLRGRAAPRQRDGQ